MIATVLIGVVVGAVSAYYGGLIDNILMRIVDVLLILPSLMATLILAAVLTPVLGRTTLPAMIALIAFGWMGYARIIRGDILSVKERDYVMAARVIGVQDSRILFRHIIPNAIFPTLVLASLGIGDVVLSFAALSFLGIGTDVGYADWGQVLSFARNWITSLNTYWYIIVWPGITLVLFVMGWNLVGDALRDVLDPRCAARSGCSCPRTILQVASRLSSWFSSSLLTSLNRLPAAAGCGPVHSQFFLPCQRCQSLC